MEMLVKLRLISDSCFKASQSMPESTEGPGVGSVRNRKCDTDQRTSRLLTQFVGSKVSSVCSASALCGGACSVQAPVTTRDRENK